MGCSGSAPGGKAPSQLRFPRLQRPLPFPSPTADRGRACAAGSKPPAGNGCQNQGLNVTQPSRAEPGSTTGTPKRGQCRDTVGTTRGQAPDPAGAQGMERRRVKDRHPPPVCAEPMEPMAH